METEETPDLISAGKVTGTSVYNTDGEHLGEVYDVMLDKRSGKVAYAILSFGGFLGMGEQYHPLPWVALKYDTRQGGYVVGLTNDQLKGALCGGRSPGLERSSVRGASSRLLRSCTILDSVR